jgi:hypothetical protein
MSETEEFDKVQNFVKPIEIGGEANHRDAMAFTESMKEAIR